MEPRPWSHRSLPPVAALRALGHEEDMSPQPGLHTPVLAEETLSILRPRRGGVIVDATVGGGGHAEALLEAVGPGGVLVGIDRDEKTLDRASRRLERFGDRFVALRGDFRDLTALLRTRGVGAVDAVLADLGVSSIQLDDPERGFSFRLDGPLDMRMDRRSGPTAAELLATAPEQELERILSRYGEEKRARPLARAIVAERRKRPLERTTQLAALVERVLGSQARRFRIHPATRTFQALRIAVNREWEGLDRFVTDAVALLRRGGRIALISFHSLEDRVVKRTLRSLAERCVCPPALPVCGCGRENLVRILTPRPVRPSREETAANPRSRSARLRAAERL